MQAGHAEATVPLRKVAAEDVAADVPIRFADHEDRVAVRAAYRVPGEPRSRKGTERLERDVDVVEDRAVDGGAAKAAGIDRRGPTLQRDNVTTRHRDTGTPGHRDTGTTGWRGSQECT